MATGVGKSKVFIMLCVEILKLNPDAKLCLLVPTEKLRDHNWKEEFDKWGHADIYKKLDRYCYVSAKKVRKK